ncbi:hypothetical protein H0N99_05060 [Candidatus Micrarchaeota archaeon]|nr:hypothetical protein [Candidatus Micrarchaeota archaeon]
MAATATKRSELVLSEGVREFFYQSCDILNKTLPGLIDAQDVLQKTRNPQALLDSFIRGDRDILKRVVEVGEGLNRVFAEKNNLSEKVVDDGHTLKFLSNYTEENFKKRLDISIAKTGYLGTAGSTILFEEGLDILHAVSQIPHEISHIEEPFGKKIKEVDRILLPLFKDPSKIVEFYSELTGASREEIAHEYEVQKTKFYTDATVFLVHLYDKELWKNPLDEKTKENLEFSKFILDPELRRADLRYKEGRAQSAAANSLSSNDNVIRAYAALELSFFVITPTPQVFFEDYKNAAALKQDRNHSYGGGSAGAGKTIILNSVEKEETGEGRSVVIKFSSPPRSLLEHYKEEANYARKAEGFRDYITLCNELADDNVKGISERIKNGEEKLRKFEEKCAKKDWMPGIGIDGKLVAINTKERRMFRIDTDKLKTGITDMDELTGKAPKLPERMG